MSLLQDPPAATFGIDPFHERPRHLSSTSHRVLGGNFRFSSNSDALIDVVDAAYGGLPEEVGASMLPLYDIQLRLVPARNAAGGIPPPLRMQAGAGLLCGTVDESNYVVLAPGSRRALVVVSEDRLALPYYVRYELIEFAVFTLATRFQGMVPLHGACLGRNDRAVLLLGGSGAGKSTLALQGLLDGLDLLAEDAVFVHPRRLLARGIPNFLHLRTDASEHVAGISSHPWVRSAHRITRRSGIEKFEVDLRKGPGRLDGGPTKLSAAIFLTSTPAQAGAPSLRRLPEAEALTRLVADQPYACGQPGWEIFCDRIADRGVYELPRQSDPGRTLRVVQQVLG